MDEVEKRERAWKKRRKMSGNGAWDLVVSHSKISTRRDCLQKYHYRYTLGLQPRDKAGPLQFGTLLHQYTELHNTGQDWLPKHKENIKRSKIEIAGHALYDTHIVKDAGKIMRAYVRAWRDEVRIARRIAVEYELPIIPLLLKPYRIGYMGYIDGIVEDDEGLIWVEERKTGKKLAEPMDRLMSPQSAMYQWGLMELGWDVKGTVWDEMRSKVPTLPKELKRGGLSQAKSIDTDVYTYKRQIKKLGLDPAHYKAILRLLKEKEEGRFFRRQWFPINKPYVESVVENLKETAIDILERPKLRTKEHGFGCRFCDYKRICDAESLDLDTVPIKRSDFTTAKQRKRERMKRLSYEG